MDVRVLNRRHFRTAAPPPLRIMIILDMPLLRPISWLQLYLMLISISGYVIYFTGNMITGSSRRPRAQPNKLHDV
jgi:hypothetical protein